MVHDLPGVGGNLHDHPMAELDFAGSTRAARPRSPTRRAAGSCPRSRRSRSCARRCCGEAFDLHLAPVAAVLPDSLLAGRVLIAVACMTPRSRGRLSLAGTDPEQRR